jgi:hypothetical protein
VTTDIGDPLPGERVLWTGSPVVNVAEREVLRDTFLERMAVSLTALLLLGLGGVCALSLLGRLAGQDRTGFFGVSSALVSLVVLVGVAYVFFGAHIRWRRKLSRLSYRVTDLRLIIRLESQVKTWYLNQLGPPILLERDHGIGHIAFGSTSAILRQADWVASYPPDRLDAILTPLLLGVPEARDVRDLIWRTMRAQRTNRAV